MIAGYKEFDGYLSDLARPPTSLASGLEKMKNSTRKYAQRQIKWIRNKLLPAVYAAGEDVGIVILDASGHIQACLKIRD